MQAENQSTPTPDQEQDREGAALALPALPRAVSKGKGDRTLMVREGGGRYRAACVDDVLAVAQAIMLDRCSDGDVLSAPSVVRDFLRFKMGTLEHEVFAVMFLDAQNRLIEYAELFRGTLTQTSVYPREVVKAALACNAAAVILSHNHPSGVAEPSHADQMLTRQLKEALALIDVRVLDHFVVTAAGALSFAERGLL